MDKIKSINGGLEVSKRALEYQRDHRDWRPKGYYKALAERFDSWKGNNFKDCEERGWENAARDIISGYYRQCEAELDCDDDGEYILRDEDVEDLAYEWREFYFCPLDSKTEASLHTHEDLIRAVSGFHHWIAEMHARFAHGQDTAHCHIVPWEFGK
jgi:hypothetical protein